MDADEAGALEAWAENVVPGDFTGLRERRLVEAVPETGARPSGRRVRPSRRRARPWTSAPTIWPFGVVLFGQHFDGHIALELRVLRERNLAHPAGTKRADDFVVAEPRARLIRWPGFWQVSGADLVEAEFFRRDPRCGRLAGVFIQPA